MSPAADPNESPSLDDGAAGEFDLEEAMDGPDSQSDLSSDDFGIDVSPVVAPKSSTPASKELEKVAPTPPELASKTSEPVRQDSGRHPILDVVDSVVGPPRPFREGEEVLRWTFCAIPTKEAVAKLAAVFLMATGDVPLRALTPKGAVFISESAGYRVDPVKFRLLASHYGLG